MMIKTRTLATALGLAALAGCGTTAAGHPTTGSTHPVPTQPASASPSPSASKAAAVPVLRPGGTATFTMSDGSSATSVTWTMGQRVVQTTSGGQFGAAPAGYEYLGFELGVRNNGPGPTPGEPSFQSSLTWLGRDGREDSTLAGTAALADPGSLGLTGTDIELQSNLGAGHYVSGYVLWQVPTAPGVVIVQARSADFTQYPVLKIEY